MSLIRTAAEREEEAELNDLRDQADRSTAEAAQILAEMTRRITVVRRPGQAARRLTAIPVLTLVAVLAYAAARGKLIPPKIKFGFPERARPPDRQSVPRNR
jgi:hypothetical protein